ncbi:MAG: serine hydrolase domain-containing protein [Planctomycetota bacterium]
MSSSGAVRAQDGFRARARALVEEGAAEHGVPGVAVACLRDGRVSWMETIGVADTRTGEPITEDTVFNVGSVSKAVAAWGAMRLVERGELRLDLPIEDVLTRWSLPESEFSDRVTLRRILSHTAGLSLHGYPGFQPGSDLPTLEESLDGATGGRGGVFIEHEPGTRFRYSGGGFTVMQLAIEEVTGRDFARYMRDEVLAPLGMSSSAFGWTPATLASAATPHDESGGPIREEHFTALAAAGLNTTLRDLSRFAAASMPDASTRAGGVLRAATIREMHRAVGPGQGGGRGPSVTGALGYQVMTFGATTLVGHAGSNTGWEAGVFFRPKTGDGLVMMTNSSNGQRVLRPLLRAWIRDMEGGGR